MTSARNWRVIAQSIISGEILNWDVPLSDIAVTYTLSGPTEISGVFAPELPQLNITAFDAWATWLHLEQDGLIRASGILKPVSLSGAEIAVSCIGASGYAHGIPYLGELDKVNVDPLWIVRTIWEHVQSYPDGNLGISVDSTTSPIRIGDPVVDPDFGLTGPYKLNWWDHRDCGEEIDNLAKQTPFDYADVATWNSTKTDVLHRVALGYPRLGRRQTNLRFAQGENIIEAIPLAESEDMYASSVIVTGSGEGRIMVRGTASERGSRIRRVAVHSDKNIDKFDRARSVALQELRRRKARTSMEEITVDASHPNARLGTFGVGDDIAVTGEFPWVGRLSIWHRITAYTWSPDRDTVVLKLKPSESFRYGPST